MNHTYYQNPVFPNQHTTPQQQQQIIPQQFIPAGNGMLPMEQSYIENILRMNKGKIATVYMSFPDSEQWKDKSFTGVIEEAGLDHLIINDPKTGMWYLLKAIYINYITFDERIVYAPPIQRRE